MKKFEIGKTYNMRSACDHECIWTYKVIERTACTVTLEDIDTGKIKKCRISKMFTEFNKAETVLPLGNYSMAPVLSA
jgi:hypothetical protein